jgi:hypothetical protein
MHHHDVGHDHNAGDWCDVADEIEVELLIKRRVHRVRRMDQEERVAIRGRTHDRLSADIAVRSGPGLDDEWLAESLRQPLTHQTSDDVDTAASRKADDDTHRPRWIGLCPSEA